ncbi:MAG: TetR/AcrR family transcriptional regulator [Gemmatimonadetes bacterium]|nr:TetR/AcrR family transcriptional regulator [Gemmatimonadota bacterium]
MVRYSKEHKEETRRRIVEAASRAYRREGIGGVGIGELMGEIGLTHGGFYAHFASKDALVAEACEQGTAESTDRILARAEKAGGAEGVRTLIDAYVSALHRDLPERGCLMPALAADVSRGAPEVRGAFTRTLRRMLGRIGRLLPGAGSRDDAPSDEALALLSGMVGAVLLARAVDDPELSERILAANRRFLAETFAAE